LVIRVKRDASRHVCWRYMSLCQSTRMG